MAQADYQPVEGQEEFHSASTGIFCYERGCVETLTLSCRTCAAATHENDCLMPAIDEAAVLLGWRLYESVWWCPCHAVAKLLACRGCGSACPPCSCLGGSGSVPGSVAAAGRIFERAVMFNAGRCIEERRLGAVALLERVPELAQC